MDRFDVGQTVDSLNFLHLKILKKKIQSKTLNCTKGAD